METTAIQKYEARGEQLLVEAGSITIVDDATREQATEFTTSARKAIKVIEAEFKPDIEKAHSLHKGLLDRMKKLCAPFKEARGIVDEEISRDWLERDRIRREEERVALEKAAAERKLQEDALQREAEQAINDGDIETAEALLDVEVVVNPVVPVVKVEQTVQSRAGSATVRKDISVEMVDKDVVLRAVVAGKLPDTLVSVDLGAAKRYAKASGLMSMPGFRVTETAVVSGRAR